MDLERWGAAPPDASPLLVRTYGDSGKVLKKYGFGVDSLRPILLSYPVNNYKKNRQNDKLGHITTLTREAKKPQPLRGVEALSKGR